MNTLEYLDPKNTNYLYGQQKHFNILKDLYIKKKLPKVIMLSGQKGIGKSTLINHFMHFIYDKANYDINKFKIMSDSFFNKQFKNNTFSNIIYSFGITSYVYKEPFLIQHFQFIKDAERKGKDAEAEGV